VKPDSLRFVRTWVGLAGHVPVRLALVFGDFESVPGLKAYFERIELDDDTA